eukprot:m.197997 g.197997  ORF g.197997 m.197997 type:complete len:574 (-) comp14913_c0_seq8:111-1832(-)
MEPDAKREKGSTSRDEAIDALKDILILINGIPTSHKDKVTSPNCQIMYRNVTLSKGDVVYCDAYGSRRRPLSIASIEGFCLDADGDVQVVVRWYYRFVELPPKTRQMYTQLVFGEYPVLLEYKDRVLLPSTNHLDVMDLFSLRGKCVASKIGPIEAHLAAFLQKENHFVCELEFDHIQNSLQRDGKQCTVHDSVFNIATLPPYNPSSSQPDGSTLREQLVWSASAAEAASVDVKDYTTTFKSAVMSLQARAKPARSLGAHIAAGRRDLTLNDSLDTLHCANYNATKALQLCLCQDVKQDALEEWTEEDIALFRKGIQTFGKQFHLIRENYLRKKTTKKLIEFYFMWRTTKSYDKFRYEMKGLRPRRSRQVVVTEGLWEASADAIFSSEGSEDEDDEEDEHIDGTPCANCGTTESPYWQRATPKLIRLCSTCFSYWNRYAAQREFKPRLETVPRFTVTSASPINDFVLPGVVKHQVTPLLLANGMVLPRTKHRHLFLPSTAPYIKMPQQSKTSYSRSKTQCVRRFIYRPRKYFKKPLPQQLSSCKSDIVIHGIVCTSVGSSFNITVQSKKEHTF